MQALIVRIVASLLRLALASVSTWFIERGVISPDEYTGLLFGIAGVLVAIGWSLYSKYGDHVTLLTAAAMEPSSLAEVKEQVKTNPAELPPSDNAVPRMPVILIAALLGAGAVSSCAKTVPTLPAAPPVVNTVDATVRDAAMYALGMSQALGKVAVDVATIERQLAQDQVIPAALHERFRVAALALADRAIAFNHDAATGVKTWADLKAGIDPIIAAVNRLIDIANAFNAGAKSALAGTVEILKGIATIFLSNLGAFGGGRDLAFDGGAK